MSLGRRSGRVSGEQARVDRLADHADALEITAPGTAPSVEAAERSVAAAEQLVAASGTLDDQRRLVRALWRQTAAYLAAADNLAAVRSAERCWALCLEVLDAAPDPGALDETAGLVVNVAGVVGPVLTLAGRQEDAERVTQACVAAAARDAVEVLRGHAAEGPYDALDLARMLQVVSRLEMVAGRVAEAAAALDEAISVLAAVAERGPRFAWFLRGMRGERDGLRGHVPDTAAVTGDSSSLPGVRAFRRAASDAAAAAVRQLMRFSDQPDRIQAALIVTLEILATAARRAGDQQAAQQAESQVGRILPLLGRRDPAYFTDLARNRTSPGATV